jgi:RHS repeat-associated protein
MRPSMLDDTASNPPRRRPPYGIYAYTAREWDPEINLYYYRNRYYDPKIGRFISEDRIGFADGPNFYVYLHGNPTGSRDPFGLDDPRCDKVPARFETPCRLECCAQHDACYDTNDCSAASWGFTARGPEAAPPGQAACVECNRDVVKCFLKCQPLPDWYDDPEKPNCYDDDTGKYGDCPPPKTRTSKAPKPTPMPRPSPAPPPGPCPKK